MSYGFVGNNKQGVLRMAKRKRDRMRLYSVETYGVLRGYVTAGTKKSAYKKGTSLAGQSIWWARGKPTNLKVKRTV